MRYLAALLLLATACTPGPREEAAPEPDTLRASIGRMLMVGFRGMTLDEAGPIADQIRAGEVGGVALVDIDVLAGRVPERNVRSPEQVRALTSQIRNAAPGPMLIAIDQEGGRVSRLKPDYGFPPTRSAQELAGTGSTDATRAQAEAVGRVLSEAGINMNLAPVVDVNVNPSSPAIGALGRSYSTDPVVVADHALATIEGLQAHGVLTSLKHFPGHGSAADDSHLGLTDVTDTWTPAELDPYRLLLRSGRVDSIMTAHVFNSELDPDWPATLSPPTIELLLRDDLGFGGVVVSDDMQMGAIQEHYGLEVAVRQALLAGVDVLVFANNNPVANEPDIAPRVTDIIVGLVEEGGITRDRIEMSVARIDEMLDRSPRLSNREVGPRSS